MLLTTLRRQALEPSYILEQHEHPLDKVLTGQLVARLITRDLYQLTDVVMAEPVFVAGPPLLHAATVRSRGRGKQRRLQ